MPSNPTSTASLAIAGIARSGIREEIARTGLKPLIVREEQSCAVA